MHLTSMADAIELAGEKVPTESRIKPTCLCNAMIEVVRADDEVEPSW